MTAIDWLAQRLERGPTDERPRSLPRRLARDASLRAMKPFTAYQRDVNNDVLASLREVDARAHAELELIVRRTEQLVRRADEIVGRLDSQRLETDRSIYLAIAELSRRYRASEAPSDARALTEFELRCFSQHGEDGVIAEILRRVGRGSSHFVEFGIETGREGNCVFLADVLGWEGLFVEADESDYQSLARKYAATDGVRTLNETITPGNIEDVFASAGVPAEPDVLSIDVDGQDYWLWEALDAYRARVVVIEYNPLLPAGRQLVQPRDRVEPWDGTNYFGASLDALCALAARKRYQLVHTDLAAGNAFFVRADVAAELFLPPEAVPRRHEPNYFLRGYHHPVDPQQRQYTELDPG